MTSSELLIEKLKDQQIKNFPGQLLIEADAGIKCNGVPLTEILKNSIPNEINSKGIRLLCLNSIPRETKSVVEITLDSNETFKLIAEAVKKEEIEERDGSYFGISFEFSEGPISALEGLS